MLWQILWKPETSGSSMRKHYQQVCGEPHVVSVRCFSLQVSKLNSPISLSPRCSMRDHQSASGHARPLANGRSGCSLPHWTCWTPTTAASELRCIRRHYGTDSLGQSLEIERRFHARDLPETGCRTGGYPSGCRATRQEMSRPEAASHGSIRGSERARPLQGLVTP